MKEGTMKKTLLTIAATVAISTSAMAGGAYDKLTRTIEEQPGITHAGWGKDLDVKTLMISMENEVGHDFEKLGDLVCVGGQHERIGQKRGYRILFFNSDLKNLKILYQYEGCR